MRRLSFTFLFLALAAISSAAQTPDSPENVVPVTLDQAIQIAISENASVKVADLEIKRSGYARKGTYASLFPQIDGSGAYQRTIKKQVMYMDINIPGMPGGGDSDAMSNGIEMGRWNTWTAGVSANMPLVNAQMWKSLKISDADVELAVEKARSSRIETVTQVKKAYFTVLLAKQAFEVYKSVYENALANLELTQKKYNAQRASELDLTRSKTTYANAIPNVFDAENAVELGLWQLKAVMGVDLDMNIDVVGSLNDYAYLLMGEDPENKTVDLTDNSTLRQLSLQAAQLADAVKMQQYAYIPSLGLGFNYSINAMANNYKFSEYNWSTYSYVGISLQIPIFAGGRRYYATRQSRNRYEQLSLQRADTERQLEIALHQYLSQMETKMKSYQSACTAEQTARKAYGIASKTYEVGRSTITELSSAALSLTQAQLSVSQAVYDFLVAKSNLEETLGYDFTE